MGLVWTTPSVWPLGGPALVWPATGGCPTLSASDSTAGLSLSVTLDTTSLNPSQNIVVTGSVEAEWTNSEDTTVVGTWYVDGLPVQQIFSSFFPGPHAGLETFDPDTVLPYGSEIVLEVIIQSGDPISLTIEYEATCTDDDPPAADIALSLTATDCDNLQLDWSSTVYDHYELWYSLDGADWILGDTPAGGTTTSSYTVDASSGTWRFRLRGIDLFTGPGPFSNLVTGDCSGCCTEG